MIRFARTDDTARVLDLWKICFPGDEAFTAWYFERQYDPTVTLVEEEDGVLCAMLQMLPYQLQDSKGIRPVTYIYGACTAPEYRRQHRMDRLLEYTFALDREHGRAASVLIPQEEWLFGFYRQFGYETAFYTSSEIVATAQCIPETTVRKLTEADIPQMQQLYNAENGMQLLRSERDWKTQLALFDALGAGAFGLEQQGRLTAYAFVWHDGAEKLWAQELCGVPELSGALLDTLHCREIKCTTRGIQQKLGCIRYHDDTPVQLGYFNLLFN